MIKITSPTLSNGSQVKLTATVIIDRTVSVSGGTYWDLSLNMPLLGGGPSGSVIFSEDSNHASAGHSVFTVQKELTVGIGDILTPYQTFNANLQASATDGSSQSGTLNVAHTIHFYLTPQTDGVVVNSLGGATYQPADVAAVPEPSTLSMFGFGIVSLLAACRRKMRR